MKIIGTSWVPDRPGSQEGWLFLEDERFIIVHDPNCKELKETLFGGAYEFDWYESGSDILILKGDSIVVRLKFITSDYVALPDFADRMIEDYKRNKRSLRRESAVRTVPL